jgi:hypothetical protein
MNKPHDLKIREDHDRRAKLFTVGGAGLVQGPSLPPDE